MNDKPFDFALGGLGWYAHDATPGAVCPVSQDKVYDGKIQVLLLQDSLDLHKWGSGLSYPIPLTQIRWRKGNSLHTEYDVIGWRYYERTEFI